MKKESLERRLYDILKDGRFHSSYDLTVALNGEGRPLFRLSGRVSDLKARGCTIETLNEKEYHKYLLFDEKVTVKLIGELPKRFWYRLCWTPENVWEAPKKKYERKDTTELTTTLADGTILGLI
jgi:hypothetical protein